MPVSAKIVADSISKQGKRLMTVESRFPKFILSEFNTHRMLSRNASSSRAIPTAKYIKEVRSPELRAVPEAWGLNKKGMQAGDGLKLSALQEAQWAWEWGAQRATDAAEMMLKTGAHKQIVNRILEPFVHVNVVASATEWDNFFGLRLHKDADPTMQALARVMWEARQASTPKLLMPGQWHLPYIQPTDEVDCERWVRANDTGMTGLMVLIRVSVARCARVSYRSFETGKQSTIEEDLKLYDKLVAAQPIHPSPAEHQGTPDYEDEEVGGYRDGRWGNFQGWVQYRKTLPGEHCAPLPEGY